MNRRPPGALVAGILLRLSSLAYPRDYQDRFGPGLWTTAAMRPHGARRRGRLAFAWTTAFLTADICWTGGLLRLARLRDRLFWPSPSVPARKGPRTLSSLATDIRHGARGV